MAQRQPRPAPFATIQEHPTLIRPMGSLHIRIKKVTIATKLWQPSLNSSGNRFGFIEFQGAAEQSNGQTLAYGPVNVGETGTP
jgi:hypothetical protein